MNYRSLQRVLSVAFYYIKAVKNNRVRLIDMFLWPFLELLMFGLLSRYLLSDPVKVDLIKVIPIALIYWFIFSRSMGEIILQINEDVVSRNLSNILATPVSTHELVGGLFLASLIKTFVNILILTLLSVSLFHLNLLSIGPIVSVYVTVMLLWGIGLGLFVASLHFIIGSRAGVLTWVISGLMQPLSLLFYPREFLPQTLRYLSYLVPTSYVFESLKLSITSGRSDFHFIESFLGIFITFVLSYVFLLKAVDYSRKTGMLIRL